MDRLSPRDHVTLTFKDLVLGLVGMGVCRSLSYNKVSKLLARSWYMVSEVRSTCIERCSRQRTRICVCRTRWRSMAEMSPITGNAFVVGVRDDATRRKLLQVRDLTLKNAIDICKACEEAGRQLKTMAAPEDVQPLYSLPSLKQPSPRRGGRAAGNRARRRGGQSAIRRDQPVSYTHLTLPTILRV